LFRNKSFTLQFARNEMSRIYQPANTKPAANSTIPSGSSSIGSSSVSINNNNNNNKNTQLNSTQNNLSNGINETNMFYI